MIPQSNVLNRITVCASLEHTRILDSTPHTQLNTQSHTMTTCNLLEINTTALAQMSIEHHTHALYTHYTLYSTVDTPRHR